MKLPLVSIIIVNYNGYQFLKNCLSSILKNTYSNYEIIVADNGSTDQSVSKIKKDFSQESKIFFIELKKNIGPSAARNEAFKIAKGEFIGFLDNDTQVDKNWIKEAVKLFQKNPKIGIIQSKLLLLDHPNRIDYVGELIGNLGFLKSIGTYGEIDKNQYSKNHLVLAAKSAGMFIRSTAFIKSDQFDPDYFIFMEETDLGWRVWMTGFKNIFCPKSIVYHKFSSSRKIMDKDFHNYLLRFHGCKNYIQTLIKNLSTKNLIKIVPVHIFLWFSLATFLVIIGDFKSAKNIYRGIFWVFKNLKKILNKRKIIQSKRTLTDQKLFKDYHLMIKTSFFFYFKNFFASHKKVVSLEEKI